MAEPQFELVLGEKSNEISAGVNYNITVTTSLDNSNGAFYLGAVELVNSEDQTDVIPISDVDDCLEPEGDPSCNFTVPPVLLGNDGQGSKLYSISLNQIGPRDDRFQLDRRYVVRVTWAYTPTAENRLEAFASGHGQAVNFVAAPPPSEKTSPPASQSLANATPTSSDGVSVTGAVSETTSTDPGDGIGGIGGIAGKISAASASSSPTGTTDSDNAVGQNQTGGGGGGLSTGAKAGIAIGVVLGVLALLALIFLCLRRRKSKRVTAGGYFGNAPGSSKDLREKEAGVGIAALPVSPSPTNDGNNHNAAAIARGNSARVVDGATMERGDNVGRHATTGHTAAAPLAAAGAAGVTRKPVGQRTVSDERVTDRDGAISAQSQVLTDEERARWEEEERRLDEDIAEAERRRLA